MSTSVQLQSNPAPGNIFTRASLSAPSVRFSLQLIQWMKRNKFVDNSFAYVKANYDQIISDGNDLTSRDRWNEWKVTSMPFIFWKFIHRKNGNLIGAADPEVEQECQGHSTSRTVSRAAGKYFGRNEIEEKRRPKPQKQMTGGRAGQSHGKNLTNSWLTITDVRLSLSPDTRHVTISSRQSRAWQPSSPTGRTRQSRDVLIRQRLPFGTFCIL